MTDLEMTKLCAEAMGLNWEAEQKRMADRDGKWLHGYETPRYDPLHDDAQAMALVKSLRLNIEAPEPPAITYWTVYTIDDPDRMRIRHNDDLNRAIVECVAKKKTTE